MVNPVASQVAPVILPGTSSDTSQPVADAHAATQVNPTEKSDTQSQTNSSPQRWPHRKPMGDIIEPQKSSLDTALEQLNENLKAWATGVRFDMDPDTQRLIVSLVDNESGDVIRTVPSDAVLQISKMIAQFQGNGINTKA